MTEQQTPATNTLQQQRPDYENQILDLIQKTLSPKALREELEAFHANDIAIAFTKLDDASRDKLFKLLDTDRLAEIIPYLEMDEQVEYLNEINIKKSLSILSEMEPQDAGQILKRLSKTRRDVIFELLDADTRKMIKRINAYSDEEIGSQMSTDFIKIPHYYDIKDTMRALRNQVRETDTDNLSILYVVDENDLYYGAIRIQDLFAARADSTELEDIIEVNFPIVYANETIDSLMEDLKDYAEDSIPVLNNDNQIEGIITKQNLLEVFAREMDEDYAKLAGLSAQEDLDETTFESIKKRTPWLLLLLVLSLLVSGVISLFESVVAKLTVALVFQSLILDMAGNVGTQSLAVSIRVLADPNVTKKQKLYLIGKEVKTGLTNGVIIGSGSAVVLGAFIHFFNGFAWDQSYAIATCISCAMVVAMVISSFTGTVIPIFFQMIKVDPAAASGPLITTLNDLIGATTYYSMVWFFLIQVMQL
ncbi:magnesium transporter [Allobaculum stercoricanis]|uniref:magnesium transporter n=1 Tax=Allobaculum stercoricanis TaxID=174709 RepID=UPI00035FC999|nr:magnesium transporter [Allobaculum stercoricanis]